MLKNGIKRSQLLAYAAPAFCLAIMAGPAASMLQGIYTQHFGLLLADLAAIIFICRIFDAITDPTIGYFSDLTRNSYGGRKTWVAAGSLLSIIAVYFLFIPPEQVTSGYFFFWFLLAYLGWTLIEIPHMAWGSELSRDYNDRSVIFSYKACFWYIGFVIFLALPLLPIFETREYTPEIFEITFYLLLIAFPLTVFIALRFCPQGEIITVEKRESLWSLIKGLPSNKPLLLFVLVFVLTGFGIGMQTAVAFLHATSFLEIKEISLIYVFGFPLSIIGLPVWLKIANKIGKHYALAIGLVASAVCFLCLGFMKPGEDIFMFYFIVFAAIQFCQGSFVAIAPAMMGDIVDYGILKTGDDHSGTYFALYTFINKFFQGVGGGVGFALAAWYGFEPSNFVNSESVTFAMQLIMGYIPATIFIIAAFVALKSPITKAYHKVILQEISDKEISDKEIKAEL